MFKLNEGATVRNAQGDTLGKVDRFVLDPGSGKVTHLVVRQGLLFKEDKLVATDQVDTVEDGDPVLTADIAPQDLPRFMTEHYVDAGEYNRTRLGWNFGTASIWRYPTVAAGMPAYPAAPAGIAPRPVRVTTERNVDDDAVVIGDDTPVLSTDGERVGEVTQVMVDDNGNLSCLVIDTGILSGERVLPSHWIDSISEGSVKLAVEEKLLDELDSPA